MRNLLFTTIIILCQISVSFGQQVWPGDLNNNGIVNNIDVLYWAVAKDATGAGRQSPTTTWIGQDLPATLWGQNFPNGLNYAYADADGDGDVDDDDKTVIENNFGQVHGVVIPDEYSTGNSASDPILQLSTDAPVVAPQGTLLADLSLGTETDSISEFYGIAFTVVYDPTVVGNKGNGFRLNLLADTWMNGKGNEKVIQFIKNDRDNGVAQIAIVRKNGETVSGFGKVGTFSIVMEDIVVGLSKIVTSDIQMVNLGLDGALIAASELEFSTDSTLSATVQRILNQGLKLYPNPVSGGEITIQLENPAEQIRLVQLYDTSGRLLQQQRSGEGSASQKFLIGDYPSGIYTAKIFTDQHIYVRSFFK